MANSTNDPTSRYVNGGDIELRGPKLGWWEKRILPTSETDIEITLGIEYHNRPDILAARAYGKQSYMWMILQYNKILDPDVEFVEGAKIRLPLPNRVVLDIITKRKSRVIE